jgi:hypothetical protein
MFSLRLFRVNAAFITLYRRFYATVTSAPITFFSRHELRRASISPLFRVKTAEGT